ncbi:DUF5317 domain-containing protein [Bacillus sp. 1P10SD]|uniref:DUF5317 domain-containing protein n=1 Tax=Bacillus sp. 1P10SD TaxID=3132265 RepID=UPI0039A4FD68
MKYFLLIAILFTLVKRRNPLTFIYNIEFQWPLLILISFGVQIALAFITIETKNKLEWILVLTFLGIIAGLWKNRHLAGIKWMVTGALLNLTALMLHGGFMPVSEEALVMTGQTDPSFESDSRHRLMEDSMPYWILGDWVPVVRYVLSPGDFLVGLGIVLLIFHHSSKIKPKGERQ